MKTARWAALAGAAALFAPAAAQAQWKMDFEVVPFAGATVFLASLPIRFAVDGGGAGAVIIENGTLEDAWTTGINAGVRFDDKVAIEGTFAFTPTSFSATSGPADNGVDQYSYGLTGLFFVPLHHPFGPFMGFGIGAKTFDYGAPDIRSHTNLTGGFLIGFAWQMNDRFALRLEARDLAARLESGVSGEEDEWQNDVKLTLGLGWRMALAP